MRKIETITVLIFFILLASAAICIAAEDSAMVMDVRDGAAYLLTGERSGQKVMPMDFVSEGDRIRLEERTVVVLNYFATGVREEISGSGIVTVGNSSSSVQGDLKVTSEKISYKVPKSLAKGSDLQQSGNVSLLGRPECPKIKILSLLDTKVRTIQPVFKWKPLGKVNVYKLSVFDAKGELRWETRSETSAIPWAGQDLKPGEEYWWTVMALGSDTIIAKGDGRFSILSEEGLEKLSKDEKNITDHYPKESTERLILFGLLYQNYGLRDDARAIFLKLHEMHPENKNFVLYLSKLDADFESK